MRFADQFHACLAPSYVPQEAKQLWRQAEAETRAAKEATKKAELLTSKTQATAAQVQEASSLRCSWICCLGSKLCC